VAYKRSHHSLKTKEDVVTFLRDNSLIEQNGCWTWTRSTKQGYGQFVWNGKIHRLHRLSWELYNGEIPKGVYVLHKCDNPGCWNPSHLYLGTAADNGFDTGRKHGRRRWNAEKGTWDLVTTLTETPHDTEV
jgi:hypothetical protein